MKEQIELNIDMGNELGADSAVESPSIDFSTDSGAGGDLKLQFSTEPLKK